MIACVTARRSMLLAGTIAGFLSAAPVFAQQPPASPPAAAPAAAPALPSGSALIGRPEGNPAAAKLAPVARATARRRRSTSCRPPSSSCRPAFTSRSMPAASPMRARCASATRARVFVGTRFGNKVYRRRQEGRQDRAQDGRLRPAIARTGSPITTARSTSPSCRRFPRSTMSRTISTIRRSRR